MKIMPATFVCCVSVFGISVLLAASEFARADETTQACNVLLRAANPDPKTLPTLIVWQQGSRTMVAATFPNVPQLTCDCWCYESPMDFVDCRPLDGGGLELRHRFRSHPYVLLTTDMAPEPGAVDVVGRAEVDKKTGGTLPEDLLQPNLCWQLRRAAGFCSKPDPFPEFIMRCFIFTKSGRTFLDKTVRRKIPVRPADHRYNNPPWVQMYVRIGHEVPKAAADSWADYSPDQYTVPVIGTVSRNGKYLAALANDSAMSMCQAWHDCLHNNPEWLPADAPPETRTWRLKIYAMDNDPEALLERVRKDYPALEHGEK